MKMSLLYAIIYVKREQRLFAESPFPEEEQLLDICIILEIET